MIIRESKISELSSTSVNIDENGKSNSSKLIIAFSIVLDIFCFYAFSYNGPRVGAGLPAHKCKKFYEKGGLAATRCYVKRRVARFIAAYPRRKTFFPDQGSHE